MFIDTINMRCGVGQFCGDYLELFVFVAKCKQDSKVVTYSSQNGTVYCSVTSSTIA